MPGKPNYHHRAMRRFFAGIFNTEIRTPRDIELILEGFSAYDEDHDRFTLSAPPELNSQTIDRMIELFWMPRQYKHRPDMSQPGKIKFETKKHNYLEIRNLIMNETLFVASRYHD